VNLDQLRSEIEPFRHALLNHALYHDLNSPQALRTFMQYHVFAVWDFMSLLKALQQRLCCVSVPWLPVAHAEGSRLVNEIVLGEESDSNGRGGHCSHFELYRHSMTQFGADTSQIDKLLDHLRTGMSVRQGLQAVQAADPIRQFVERTFAIIEDGDLCRIAAAFTFGREDLLPGVFQRIVDELSRQAAGGLEEFQFYLQRHVELDGEEHGPLAAALMTSLCGTDPVRWQSASDAAVASLKSRLILWDGIHSVINGKQPGR
jgi:hypothetical protein